MQMPKKLTKAKIQMLKKLTIYMKSCEIMIKRI